MRRQPQKRSCIDSASPTAVADQDPTVESILSDDSIPVHLKVVISCLLEDSKRLHVMMNHCHELTKVIDTQKSEISSLKAALPSSVAAAKSSEQVHSVVPECVPRFTGGSCSYEDIERAKSVVINGVTESLAQYSSARVIHDHNAVRENMDFLEIDCSTVAAYRLGRFDPNRSRSIKVALPASSIARLMLRRAPRDISEFVAFSSVAPPKRSWRVGEQNVNVISNLMANMQVMLLFKLPTRTMRS